jgi:protein-tyrosine phosphatase
MKVEAYWISGPWPGRLGIVPRPRGGDWLAGEVLAWREARIDIVASLLTPDEVSELDLRHEATLTRAEGVEFLSLPIPDYGVPPEEESFAQVVRQLDQALHAGRSVAVYCRQGIGRTSVLVAALLVAAGVEPEDAFQRIAKARGRPVPDTREQREWVAQHAARLLTELYPASNGSQSPRPFGLCAGELTVPDEFDDPLPEDVLATFEVE